jgi:hypothetical protein
MTERAKTRIETQIRRRRKTGGSLELEAEWDAQQGDRPTGLKMNRDAMAPRQPQTAKPSSS